MQRSVSYVGAQGERGKDIETSKNLHVLIGSAAASRPTSNQLDHSSIGANSCHLQLSQPSSPVIGSRFINHCSWKLFACIDSFSSAFFCSGKSFDEFLQMTILTHSLIHCHYLAVLW